MIRFKRMWVLEKRIARGDSRLCVPHTSLMIRLTSRLAQTPEKIMNDLGNLCHKYLTQVIRMKRSVAVTCIIGSCFYRWPIKLPRGGARKSSCENIDFWPRTPWNKARFLWKLFSMCHKKKTNTKWYSVELEANAAHEDVIREHSYQQLAIIKWSEVYMSIDKKISH